jgi:sugar lactone lactonase YvrE
MILSVLGLGARAVNAGSRGKAGAMRKGAAVALAVALSLAVGLAGLAPLAARAQDVKPLRVVSEQTVKGFAFPETVTYDPRAKVLYVSEFGSELKPADKDGKGRISKASLTGEVLDKQFLPAPGGEALNKPKGSWVAGNRFWVTDIDVAWVFDLTSRRGRKVALPGVQFANDLAVMRNALYISDNRTDQIVRVEPADFLEMSGEPKVTQVFQGKSINPNGIYPAKDGSLLMVGFLTAEQPRSIYSLSAGGEIKTLAKDVGRLDGLYEMDDGTLLVTDWNTGSLFRWSAAKGIETLAKGFKGPADFCVIPEAKGFLVVVPDLVLGELRLVRLAR